jgi:hypothetical protein
VKKIHYTGIFDENISGHALHHAWQGGLALTIESVSCVFDTCKKLGKFCDVWDQRHTYINGLSISAHNAIIISIIV